jgi:predicted transcriptional regulator of viral defense system
MREEMRSHRRLARLGEEQDGVVSARQLRRLGFSEAAIGRLARAERLHRLHRGVYAIGHPAVADRGRCRAAILACGRGAVLSHASAAWLWGLLPRCPKVVHVIVPSNGHGHADIALHHSSTLTEEEWGRMARIPVTALARTLLDLAATATARELWNAVERAERLDKLDLIEIDAMLLRRKGDRGAARLRRALEIYRDPVFSRARSERLFLQLCKRANLPRPRINTWVGKFEIDAYWEAESFAVEIDGWETHRTRKAFDADRLRQEEMKLAGIDSIRISARRIERAPRQVGRRLSILLTRRRTELGRSS